MSPTREMIMLQQQQQQQQRGARLAVNTDSRNILKINNVHSNPPNPDEINRIVNNGTVQPQKHPQQRRQPVIIYTHTPTVFHVEENGFKDLVQKLTGMPRPEGENKEDSKTTPSTSQTVVPDHQEENKIMTNNQIILAPVEDAIMTDHDNYYPTPPPFPVNNGMIHPPPIENMASFVPPPPPPSDQDLPPVLPLHMSTMSFIPDPPLYEPDQVDFFRMPNIYDYSTDVFCPANLFLSEDDTCDMIDEMKLFEDRTQIRGQGKF